MLWGVTLLRLGVTYGFGSNLRRILASSTKNRFKSFFSGVVITTLLQSSTATVLIVSTFAAQGMINTAAGLAMILGADVGTTLVAQIFSMDLSWLIPVSMVAGYFCFTSKKLGKLKNIGRVLVGVALMLLALSWIREAAEPLKQSNVLPEILLALESDPLFAVLIAATLTWLAHSSLAIVLLIMSFVAGGILPIELALYMVLGANLGGVIPPILATMKDTAEARRVPVGNALIRFVGVAAAFAFVPQMPELIGKIDTNMTRQVVHFHTVFNVVLAMAFLPFTGLVNKVCQKIVEDDPQEEDPANAKYLEESALTTPSVALAAATRETLRMGDYVQQMLDDTITVFKTNDMQLLQKVREEDNTLDKLYDQIKTYMAKLSQEFMDPKEAQRYVNVLTFSTNLEHCGDVIDKNLMPLALKKIKKQIDFSEEGMKEIEHIHSLVVESVQLAQSLFVSDDEALAKQLLEDKRMIKEAEIAGMANHIERLGDGVPETISTSSLHVDIIRDYRRINSYISTVAYPVLGKHKWDFNKPQTEQEE